METTTLDTIARTLSGTMTRRSALRGLFAGAAAAVAGGVLLQTEETSAKKRKKKGGKKGGTQPASGQPQDQPQSGQPQTGQPSLLPPGTRCQSSTQCVSGYICEVPVNGSNSDRYCSGATGAQCGPATEDGDATAPFCAVGYSCHYNTGSSTGVCRAVPDEI